MTSPAPLVQVVTLDTLHGQMGMPCTTLLFLEDAHVLKPGKMRRMRFMKTSKPRAMRARSIMFSRYVRVSIVSRFLALMSRRTWVFARRAERSIRRSTFLEILYRRRGRHPLTSSSIPDVSLRISSTLESLRRRIQLSPGIPRHCQCFDLAMA